MTSTQIKIFQGLGGAGINRVEAAANKWLLEQPDGTDVLDVQTALAECVEPDGGYQANRCHVLVLPATGFRSGLARHSEMAGGDGRERRQRPPSHCRSGDRDLSVVGMARNFSI